jgi:hypothetical protein
MTLTQYYNSFDDFERTYFPNESKSTNHQIKKIEPQTVSNNLAIELLNLLK